MCEPDGEQMATNRTNKPQLHWFDWRCGSVFYLFGATHPCVFVVYYRASAPTLLPHPPHSLSIFLIVQNSAAPFGLS